MNLYFKMSIVRILIFSLLFYGISPPHISASKVTIFVPDFDGPELLGRNVATILNLKIWRTLRKAPFPNPRNLAFGSGKVLWGEVNHPIITHLDAEEIATGMLQDIQMVLWGKVWKFGNGVVGQSYLTLIHNRRLSEKTWDVEIPINKDGEIWKISVGLPKRRYEFTPIVIRKEIVNLYSTAAALTLFSAPKSEQPIGDLGIQYTAIKHKGDYTKVRSGDKTGWVHLPGLAKSTIEIIDFVGGVIRIFREDWQGAIDLFQNVIRNPNASISLKVDSYLFQIFAKEKKEQSSKIELDAAFNLNPYLNTTIVYSIMSDLNQMSKLSGPSGNSREKERLLTQIRHKIEKYQLLFSKEDPWLKKVKKLLINIE